MPPYDATTARAVPDKLFARVLARATTRVDAAHELARIEDERTDRAGAHEEMRALRKALAAAPTLTLYIPVPLTKAHIADIAEWCRREIDPALFLDVRVDSAAAGGCIFAWRGILHDFSLNYFMQAHADECARLLASLDTPQALAH